MLTEIIPADISDAARLLQLQKEAFHAESTANGDMKIAPMVETLAQMRAAFSTHRLLVARSGPDILGSVRTRQDRGTCHIGRLFVVPDHQRKGIGRALMAAAEREFAGIVLFRLITGALSRSNIRLYEGLGYRIIGHTLENVTTRLVIMEKPAGVGAS